MRTVVHIVLLALLLAGCGKDANADKEDTKVLFALQLPVGAPMPVTPSDNPLTDASVRLGKALFFEARLSRNGSISCASCHHPDRGFSDTLALSLGVDGLPGLRNAPSLGNVAYHPSFFRDGGVPTLEQQVLAPIHDELEMDHNINLAAAELGDEEPYGSLSMQAYGKPLDAYVITRAIANYERTLISGWSRSDRFLYQGDATALSAAEVRGWQLFSSAELNCAACHSGFDLTDHDFHNVGQYLDYGNDPGRERITLQPGDLGKFKTPTLRNIARTGPYMHDGAFGTLDQVIDHFASGGQPHPNLSPEMRTFVLTEEQKADLLAFLSALSDDRSLDQVP
ncbi:MAG: cytochrome c peroxidase [Flavobacteriales bacterium]